MTFPIFHPIDPASWPRLTHFSHYEKYPCSFQTTVEIEISLLFQRYRLYQRSFYAAMICAVSQAVNAIPECRMTRDGAGCPGYWEQVSPAYPLFHPDDQTFSILSSPYDENPTRMIAQILETQDQYRETKGIFPTPLPPNVFYISTLPWLNFSAFSLNTADQKSLAPIITWGKFFKLENRIALPLSFQIHHAAADGFHVSEFFRHLRRICDEMGAETSF